MRQAERNEKAQWTVDGGEMQVLTVSSLAIEPSGSQTEIIQVNPE
jgi:hypothetical protein